ncbi:MAG: TIGR00366 family protein [Planctomycetota bacterium]|nr:TIGR00366 family protein [Planctomycetota bacterium]
MFSNLGLVISKRFERVVPDPFVIAIGLTAITAIVALIWGDFGDKNNVVALLDSWRDGQGGMWKLLAFSMQMCLVLVTGYALATTKAVKAVIDSLASIPKNTAQAAALVGFVACAAGLLNWGLGLIVGALLAREVGFSMQRKKVACHYPLVVAGGYMGLLVWHGGLSGSAPLSMTTLDNAAKVVPAQFLDQYDPIMLSSSIGSTMNFFVSGGFLIGIPMLLFFLAPTNKKDIRPIGSFDVDPGEVDEPTINLDSLPDRLNHSVIIAWLLGIPLLLALCRHLYVSGFDRIGLNEITVLMLGVGLLLHGSPVGYMNAIANGAKGCAGIIIQFPLYAGIMAIMVASGLMGTITELLVAMGSEETVPLLTMLSAGFVNLFVPSGGGQWAIQAPIAIESGLQSGVSQGTMVMAVAYGDQLTNMLQPFWALPLLAITGIRARDIVGYTAIIMIAAGIWMGIGLLIFG